MTGPRETVPSGAFAFDETVPAEGRRLRAVLDAMPVPVSWADLGTARIMFMNRKFKQTFGYAEGDFATVQDWVDRAYPDPVHRERAAATWYDCFGIAGGEPREIAPVEVDILCKDGRTRTCIHGGSILPDVGWALATFVDITERKRHEGEIRHLAEVDPLTGLQNRRTFEERLASAVAEARRSGRGMCLVVLDLDRFKAINDRCGHAVGDLLLQAVAGRLQTCVRSGDSVARFGGDEFGIVLGAAVDPETVARLCDEILMALALPFAIDGRRIRVGASIGVAVFPQHGADAEALFLAADRALYRVKREGRGGWRYAEPLSAGVS